MVDEYVKVAKVCLIICGVQIPLWSMNTLRGIAKLDCMFRSDSSMVDEYES